MGNQSQNKSTAPNDSAVYWRSLCNETSIVDQRLLDSIDDYYNLVFYIATGMLVFSAIGIVINGLSFCAVRRIKSGASSHHLLLLSLTMADIVLFSTIVPMCAVSIAESMTMDRIERYIKTIICRTELFNCILNIALDISKIPLFSSILSILGLVVNLHIAIVYPLNYHTMVTQHRVIIFIILTWMLSVLLGEIETIASLFQVAISPEQGLCYYVNNRDDYTTYLLPSVIWVVCLVTLYLNMRVLYAINKSLNNVRRFSTQETKRTSNKLKLAKTSISLFVTLFFFWAPYLVASILKYFMKGTAFIFFVLICYVLLIFNSLINPFVYGLRLSEIRQSHRRMYREMCPWLFCRKDGDMERSGGHIGDHLNSVQGERDYVRSVRDGRDHLSNTRDHMDHTSSVRDDRDHLSKANDGRDHLSNMKNDRDCAGLRKSRHHFRNTIEDRDCIRDVRDRNDFAGCSIGDRDRLSTAETTKGHVCHNFEETRL